MVARFFSPRAAIIRGACESFPHWGLRAFFSARDALEHGATLRAKRREVIDKFSRECAKPLVAAREAERYILALFAHFYNLEIWSFVRILVIWIVARIAQVKILGTLVCTRLVVFRHLSGGFECFERLFVIRVTVRPLNSISCHFAPYSSMLQ
jgi:hypothetical protein